MRKLLTPSISLIVLGLAAWGVISLFGGGAERAGAGGRQPPLITAGVVAKHKFTEEIEAVGTSRAAESVAITAKTADTVGAINFVEGQQVAAGAILIEMTSTQQAADLKAARAELAEAEKAYARAADLVSKGIASRASLDSATAARDAARGRVQSIEARLADTILKAPFAGVVGLRNISIGSYVRPGDVITTLDDVAAVKGDFTIPERYLSQLKPGLRLDVQVAAYPGETFSGQVVSVDTRVDPATRAVTVRAELPNPDRKLRPGMLMSVSLLVAEREALGVPETAVLSQGDRRYVFVIGEGNVARRTEIMTGLVEPGSVEVVSGLNEGDRIVTHGANKVTHDRPVTIDGQTDEATPVAGAAGEKPA